VTSPGSPAAVGLRHVALRFSDLESAERFFVDLLGYSVEWRPDRDNLYLARLSGGAAQDNVALHRVEAPVARPDGSSALLDHVGLMVPAPDDVDRWAAWLDARGATILARPRTHRDGARSLYLSGPEGLVVQIIHHPPIR
jgi:catechol 2,3-dioxygenase-like lactoylglutathione lyase family enzyme